MTLSQFENYRSAIKVKFNQNLNTIKVKTALFHSNSEDDFAYSGWRFRTPEEWNSFVSAPHSTKMAFTEEFRAYFENFNNTVMSATVSS